MRLTVRSFTCIAVVGFLVAVHSAGPSFGENPSGPMRFRHHFIHQGLPSIFDHGLGGHESRIGDVDGDGDIDICSKPWVPGRVNALQGRMHVDFMENLLKGVKSAVSAK